MKFLSVQIITISSFLGNLSLTEIPSLLRRYATVSSPIPLVYSARYFVMNWRPASTFQAYNEPGLASHQDIGGVAMTATSTARITDLGFVSTKRAQFEFVFIHCQHLLFHKLVDSS